MPTTDLDDFFNKRQNKKKKNIGKKLDEFAKNIEITPSPQPSAASTVHQQNTDESLSDALNQNLNLNNTSNNNVNSFNPDEDWKPFESEDHKDYTGLRVNLLQNWNNENEDEDEVQQEDEVEKKPACPWSKVKQQKQTLSENENEDETDYSKQAVKLPEPEPVQQQQSQQEEVKTEEPKQSEAGKYIPPYLRAQMQQQTQSQQSQSASAPQSTTSSSSSSAGKYVPPQLRNTTNTTQNEFQTATNKKYNKNQPNINDVSEFPSLGDLNSSAKGSTDNSKNENQFEQPKRSGKVETRTNANKIDLENKFDALSS